MSQLGHQNKYLLLKYWNMLSVPTHNTIIVCHLWCCSDGAELCEAFSLFDKDGDGQITVDEVSQTMQSLGLDVRLSDVQIMVDQVDTDGQNSAPLPYISQYSHYAYW